MKTLTKIFFVCLFLLTVNFINAFADTQDRHLTGFNAVSAGGPFDVYITQGSTESVKVEAPADVINRVETEVVDGVLKIHSKHNSNWNFNWFGNNKKIIIYITAKNLNAVDVSGSGNAYFKNGITANTLRLKVSGSGDMLGRVEVKELTGGVSGSGDMKISGHAVTASIGVSGSGDFSGHDLVTTNTMVRVSGSGDASVNASSKIDASVSGSGDVRYTGAAKDISTSASGSGSVHRGN